MSDYIPKHSRYDERMIVSKRLARQMETIIFTYNIPIKKIAKALGITSCKLKHYINDDKEIPAPMLLLFCNFFNVTIADFLEGAFKYDTLGHGMYVTNCIKFFEKK